jgi:hypothetical protein
MCFKMKNLLIIYFIYYSILANDCTQVDLTNDDQNMNLDSLKLIQNRHRKSMVFGNDYLLQTIMRRLKVKATLEEHKKKKTERKQQLESETSTKRIKSAVKSFIYNFGI